MEKLIYFWVNDHELDVNGVRMTPEQAYSKFPEHKDEIKEFVLFGKPIEKLSRSLKMIEQPSLKKHYEKNAMPIEDIIADIKITVTNILDALDIKQNVEYDDAKKFGIAFVLFKYVIENSKYDESIMFEKMFDNDVYTMMAKDIHRCLCEHRSVCTSDAATLSLLYEQVGIQSRHITIAEKGSEPRDVHEVVSFNIGGVNYICDPTLIRTSLETGIIPYINTSVFAFTPNDFFDKLYPTKEVKFQHENLPLK